MKILVVSQHYQPEPFRLSDLCETLVRRGHEVTAVVGTPNYPEGKIYPGYEHGKRRDEVIGGVRVHRCPLIPRKKGLLFRFLNYFSFPLTSCLYTRRLREEYDVVLCHQTSPVMMACAGLLYAKKHRVPSVLYCMDLWPESLLAGGVKKGGAIYRQFLHLSRAIYRRADVILTSSLGFERYFMEVLRLPAGNLYYHPQYAESLFDTVPSKEPEAGRFTVLFAGNVGTAQSVETIVEAARILRSDPRIRFHVVGDGTSLERCRHLAKGLDNITFHGRRDVSEMPAYYAMADAMLLTLRENGSISYTLPGKVQSYMAAGRPIIAAAAGSSAETIAQADCGLCSAPDAAAGLAENIRRLANDPAEVRRMSENARRYYREYFSEERFFDRLESVLCGESEEPHTDVMRV